MADTFSQVMIGGMVGCEMNRQARLLFAAALTQLFPGSRGFGCWSGQLRHGQQPGHVKPAGSGMDRWERGGDATRPLTLKMG